VILRATVFHTPRNPFLHRDALQVFEDGALLLAEGKIAACGDYAQVRSANPRAPVRDLRGGLLLPGFIDTHVHFPQLRVLGGIGYSLLEWLQFNTLPEEAKFSDVSYAREVAREFVHALASHGTTTALVFGAHFVPATAALFEAAQEAGLRVVSGLVLSDRLLLPELHQTPEAAYRGSKELIARFHGTGRLLYAVTPRFALSASEAILEVCQVLLREHPGLRFQTHLNESPAEIAEVARLFPGTDYLGAYERFNLAGTSSVFAHNVHSSGSELERLAGHGSAVAHCPCSNAALGSGFFSMRAHLDAGVRFGLGTDVGGGTGFGMLKEGLQAYLLQRLAPNGMHLSAAHLLYMATRAGAEALGLEALTGDFAIGKAADIVYLRAPEDSPLRAVAKNAASAERLLAAVFTLAGQESVREVWVDGLSLKECTDSRAAGNEVTTEKAMSRPTG
jgi:guanine deaminase